MNKYDTNKRGTIGLSEVAIIIRDVKNKNKFYYFMFYS